MTTSSSRYARRFYVRHDVIGDDARANWLAAMRVVEECLEAGGGVVVLAPGLYGLRDKDEIPEGVFVEGWQHG